MQKIHRNEDNVAIYCRLAQQDDTCMALQKSVVLDYARKQGYTDVAIYADDGASGLDFNRRDFKQLNADIAEGRINVVVVNSLDRISRNVLEIAQWIDEISNKGVTLLFVNEPEISISFVEALETL